MIPIPALVIGLFASFMVGWMVHGWKFDSDYKAQMEKIQTIKASNQELADSLGLRVEEKLNKISIVHTTVERKVEREVTKVPVYLECRHSPDGFRLLNAALGGVESPTALKLDATVPSATSSK